MTAAPHFGLPGKYIRIGYGYDIERTLARLARVEELFTELREPARPNSVARTGVRHPAPGARLPSVKRHHVKEMV